MWHWAAMGYGGIAGFLRKFQEAGIPLTQEDIELLEKQHRELGIVIAELREQYEQEQANAPR